MCGGEEARGRVSGWCREFEGGAAFIVGPGKHYWDKNKGEL